MAVKRPNSKRNLDMAIRRMGTGDTDYLRMRTLIANVIVAKGDIDYVKARETCARLFVYRQAQAWPPTITANDNWSQVYEEQSMGVDVLPTVDKAVAWVNGLIARIDAS